MKRLQFNSESTPEHSFGGSVSAVTFGNFDGVHRGHRALIEGVVKQAKSAGGLSVVMSFDPHPVAVLAPGSQFKRIFPASSVADQLESLGVDVFVTLQFDKKLAATPAKDFLKTYVVEPFAPQHIFVGYDLKFGEQRQGDYELAKSLEKEFSYEAHLCEALLSSGSEISSSRIRKAIIEGDVVEAGNLLGRNYSLWGKVEAGDKRGRSIGFPTANINCDFELIPKSGVYTTEVVLKGKRYRSVTNIGYRPTFKEGQQDANIEMHIMDFNEDVYGESLEVFFLGRIRDEMKFESKEQLISQIGKDISVAKSFVGEP